MLIASVLQAMQRVIGGMQRALQQVQWATVPLVTSMVRMLQVMKWVDVPLAILMARLLQVM